MKKLICLLPLALLITGCDQAKNADVKNQAEQAITQQSTSDMKSMIKAIQNKDFWLENGKASLTFTQNEEKLDIIAGFAGVNNYFGDYSIDGNKLKLGSIATTMMAGTSKDMEAEAEFLKLLATMNKVEIQQNAILLSNGKETLKFIAK